MNAPDERVAWSHRSETDPPGNHVTCTPLDGDPAFDAARLDECMLFHVTLVGDPASATYKAAFGFSDAAGFDLTTDISCSGVLLYTGIVKRTCLGPM